MAASALVGEGDVKMVDVVVGVVILMTELHLSVVPFEGVAVNVGGPHDRRRHRVAVEVFHIAHGDVERLLVDFAVCHLEVDEQFVLVESPVEVELSKQAEAGHRGEDGFVGMGADVSHVWLILGKQRHLFVHHVAVGVAELALVVDGEDELEHAVGVLLLLFERQICHQSHLIACGCAIAIILNEGLRQGLLKDCELIDIALEAIAAEEHVSGHAGHPGGRI